jgi:hypothetical protein
MKRIAEILHEHGLYANDCGKISGVDISVWKTDFKFSFNWCWIWIIDICFVKKLENMGGNMVGGPF